jgi:hypothetical protein
MYENKNERVTKMKNCLDFNYMVLNERSWNASSNSPVTLQHSFKNIILSGTDRNVEHQRKM